MESAKRTKREGESCRKREGERERETERNGVVERNGNSMVYAMGTRSVRIELPNRVRLVGSGVPLPRGRSSRCALVAAIFGSPSPRTGRPATGEYWIPMCRCVRILAIHLTSMSVRRDSHGDGPTSL